MHTATSSRRVLGERLAKRHRVIVREHPFESADATSCVLGKHLRLDYRVLENCYAHELEFVHIDLLYLAGAVMFADRKICRPITWRRHLDVSVPVHEPSRFESARNTLELALEFLTGDSWRFHFLSRHKNEDGHRFLKLRPQLQQRLAILPFSGGLDSFAASRLAVSEQGFVPILITTRHGASPDLKDKVKRAASSPTQEETMEATRRHVGMPICFSLGKGRTESSCRTRAFLFFSVATIAAHLVGARDVLVPENGQGSLAVTLISAGSAHPPRGTHPGFSRLFSQFANTLLGNTPRFHHPYLWSTKGQMLSKLRESGLDEGWEMTRSCARKLSRQKGAGTNAQCGICCNCLLRRVSLRSAGIASIGGAEAYVWEDLNAETLAQALNPQFVLIGTNDNDRTIATSAVYLHHDLANAARWSDDHPSLQRVASEVTKASDVPKNVSIMGLRSLLEQHRSEWRAFLAPLSRDSWLVKQLGVVS